MNAKKKPKRPASMLAEQYHLLHAEPTRRAMFDEAMRLQEEDRNAIGERTIKAVMAELRRQAILFTCPAPEYRYGEVRIKSGNVTMDVRLSDDAEIKEDPRPRILRKRAESLKVTLSGATAFSRYCRARRGDRKAEPIPVSELDSLWADWIDFTCGPRP